MSHLDELDEFEAELELQLKKEYTAVFGLFRYCVLTQDATYLCNTLDLDLLLYGDAVIEEPGLLVPHPRLHERPFVLEPLADLDPELEVPGRGRVEALLAELDSKG